MTNLGFAFDANSCTGCKACVVACKDVHNLPVGAKLRKVLTGEAGSWTVDAATGTMQPAEVFSYSISYSCMHCAAPACMTACPKGAMAKDAETGVVAIDRSLCIGCGRCVRACPWQAPVLLPRIDGTRKSWKCDLCRDVRNAGEEPVCVAACSMRCLQVVEFPEGEQGHLADPLLADEPALGPHMVLKPHRKRLEFPDAPVRVHSMPEEYRND